MKMKIAEIADSMPKVEFPENPDDLVMFIQERVLDMYGGTLNDDARRDKVKRAIFDLMLRGCALYGINVEPEIFIITVDIGADPWVLHATVNMKGMPPSLGQDAFTDRIDEPTGKRIVTVTYNDLTVVGGSRLEVTLGLARILHTRNPR